MKDCNVLYTHLLQLLLDNNNDSCANDNSSNECKSPSKVKGNNNIDNKNNRHNYHNSINSNGNVIGNIKKKLSAVDTLDYPFELELEDIYHNNSNSIYNNKSYSYNNNIYNSNKNSNDYNHSINNNSTSKYNNKKVETVATITNNNHHIYRNSSVDLNLKKSNTDDYKSEIADHFCDAPVIYNKNHDDDRSSSCDDDDDDGSSSCDDFDDDDEIISITASIASGNGKPVPSFYGNSKTSASSIASNKKVKIFSKPKDLKSSTSSTPALGAITSNTTTTINIINFKYKSQNY